MKVSFINLLPLAVCLYLSVLSVCRGTNHGSPLPVKSSASQNTYNTKMRSFKSSDVRLLEAKAPDMIIEVAAQQELVKGFDVKGALKLTVLFSLWYAFNAACKCMHVIIISTLTISIIIDR